VAQGVERLVVVGYDLPSSEMAVALSREHAAVVAAVGVHPHDSRNYDSTARRRLAEIAREPKVVAVGEIGLDYHYDFSSRESQWPAFRDQLDLASECGLPVVVHCREAYGDVLDVLEAGGVRSIGGVMHCWGGEPDDAQRALALGLYLGFAGTITFKNADAVREAARSASEGRILVETDSPYLAPVPHRGKRNEPAYVLDVASRLAAIRGRSLADVATATTANARRLFRDLA
jgi:TatD DNase family protein